MKNIFLQETWYLIKSKTILVVILASLFFVGFASVQAIGIQKDSANSFELSKQLYSSNSEFETDLKKDYQSSTSSQGATGEVNTTVDNVARYSFETLVNSQEQLSPVGFSRFVYGSLGLSIIPILFAILGIQIATYDFKNKTYKRKLDNNDWKTIYFGKLLSLILIVLSSYIIITVFSLLAGLFLNNFVSIVDVTSYPVKISNLNNSLFLQTVFTTAIVGIVTSIIWFSFGLLLKKSTITIIIFLIYHAVIPNLGKYDYKNAIMNFASEKFDQLVLQPLPLFDINYSTSFILIIGYLLIISFISFIYFKKLGRYNF